MKHTDKRPRRDAFGRRLRIVRPPPESFGFETAEQEFCGTADLVGFGEDIELPSDCERHD